MNKGFAFARLASYFLWLSQRKVTKEKATPYHLFPKIRFILGRQAETRYAQTAACRKPPKIIQILCAVAGDLKSKSLKPRHSVLDTESSDFWFFALLSQTLFFCWVSCQSWNVVNEYFAICLAC